MLKTFSSKPPLVSPRVSLEFPALLLSSASPASRPSCPAVDLHPAYLHSNHQSVRLPAPHTPVSSLLIASTVRQLWLCPPPAPTTSLSQSLACFFQRGPSSLSSPMPWKAVKKSRPHFVEEAQIQCVVCERVTCDVVFIEVCRDHVVVVSSRFCCLNLTFDSLLKPNWLF